MQLHLDELPIGPIRLFDDLNILSFPDLFADCSTVKASEKMSTKWLAYWSIIKIVEWFCKSIMSKKWNARFAKKLQCMLLNVWNCFVVMKSYDRFAHDDSAFYNLHFLLKWRSSLMYHAYGSRATFFSYIILLESFLLFDRVLIDVLTCNLKITFSRCTYKQNRQSTEVFENSTYTLRPETHGIVTCLADFLQILHWTQHQKFFNIYVLIELVEFYQTI